MMKCNCGCEHQADSCVYDRMPLAMAYVPMQVWREIYCEEQALQRGTIFSELDLPFFGKGGAL